MMISIAGGVGYFEVLIRNIFMTREGYRKRIRGRLFFIFFLVLAPWLAYSFSAPEADGELIKAVISGNKQAVVSLLGGGANVDSRDRYGKTALMWAILKGRGELARYLVEKGANVNARDWEQTTSLIWAVVAGDRDMVMFLIENKANFRKKDMYGDTALGMALKRGRNEIAEILKNAGAVE